MITWIRGDFRILTRENAMVLRQGLVTEDGLWGIFLDGEHLNLTHTASGKRLTRTKSFAVLDELLRHLMAMPTAWTLANPQLTPEQEVELGALFKSLT